MTKPKKRIVVCADGTWNDPEDQYPTNVLRVARALRPKTKRGYSKWSSTTGALAATTQPYGAA